MTTTHMNTAEQEPAASLLRIKTWVLFMPYAIIPAVILFIIINSVFRLHLQSSLPRIPQQIFIFTLIFENPHILASSFIFLDSEYLKYYRQTLVLRLSVVALIVAACFVFFGVTGFYAFFYAWTIVHVTKQQLGIGKMMNRKPSKLYDIWGWLFTGMAIIVAVAIGFFGAATAPIPEPILWNIIIVGSSIIALAGFALMWMIPTKLGKLYLLGNIMMLVMSAVCYAQDMPLFAILIPRVVHDVTAYIMYVTHDTNRNTPVPHQFVYRVTKRFMPIWVVTIGLSVLIGGTLSHVYSHYAVIFLITMSLIHYTTEAFTWRGTSLHRQYLKFSS